MRMQVCLLAFHKTVLIVDLLKAYPFFIVKICLRNIYLPPSVEDISTFCCRALLFYVYDKYGIHLKFIFVFGVETFLYMDIQLL